MVKLIQKVGYIRSGGAGGYLKYIATRKGVELQHSDAPVTQNQQKLIAQLLRDFPDAKNSFEYADYQAAPTAQNASAFIASAIDSNAQTFTQSDGYLQYIATRPRAEQHGGHGLFGRQERVELDTALHELEQHDGPVWTVIYSLRREDATRLQFDSAASWRTLLMAHQSELADAVKIPADALHWYAAFHDEGMHPHIHMMLWSDAPKQGYLSRDGVLAMRSKLTNSIFKDELTQLYQQKDISYQELTAAARSTMGELIQSMNTGLCDSPQLAAQLMQLARRLDTVTGKKKYGYLPKDAKLMVNTIVDTLAQLPEVAQCYQAWNRLRDELESYYKETPRLHLPLSEQKEFRNIKNIIVQEAELLRQGAITFDDEQTSVVQDAPPDTKQNNSIVNDSATRSYRRAKQTLEEGQDIASAMPHLHAAAERGNADAQYVLGKCYLLGQGVEQDSEQAESWFTRAADQGNSYARFALAHFGQAQLLPALLSVTRLLHHMSRVFQNNAMPPANPAGIRMDSKRRRELMRRRGVLGQQPDDHELDQTPNLTMRKS